MSIKVTSQMIIAHADCEDIRSQWYPYPTGLVRRERRSEAHENDFSNGVWVRESPDNGRTWGEWVDDYKSTFVKLGETDEIMFLSSDPNIYNPFYKHFVSSTFERIFINGHVKAYGLEWGVGANDAKDHGYISVRKDGETEVRKQLIKYMSGDEFDPDNIRNPGYLNRNQGGAGTVRIASNGDILFPMSASIASCCQILGLDPKEVFKTATQLMAGLIVGRGVWNEEKGIYDLSYSKPVVMSDLQSSRAVCEPTLAELKSGRIIVVIRGSNAQSKAWKTRIDEFMPAFKWYTYSDDGGKTFSPIMPWHFDTREVVYSSATYSELVRTEKTGKLYWIGNITDPAQTDGNYLRWPLQICEVDEDYGFLKKDTLTVIDTKREGESEKLQLSNFSILEDRETGNLEIQLAKPGQYDFDGKSTYHCESWKYIIELN